MIILSQILGAKIFRTQYADNRNTIETEKNASETTKMTSEVSAIVVPPTCQIVLYALVQRKPHQGRSCTDLKVQRLINFIIRSALSQ